MSAARVCAQSKERNAQREFGTFPVRGLIHGLPLRFVGGHAPFIRTKKWFGPPRDATPRKRGRKCDNNNNSLGHVTAAYRTVGEVGWSVTCAAGACAPFEEQRLSRQSATRKCSVPSF
jgi:hypothetical protein